MADDHVDDVPLLVDTAQSMTSTPKNGLSVPVTIVTGYLGSGKSTLLRHITQSNTGKRIAIILNEFGDTADVERSLRVSEDTTEVEEWLDLDNGCMCCTAKDAGVAAIEKLMERSGRFDYVLLETSGLADPAPIANMFWLDSALMSSLHLDGVVTVVDAGNIVRSLKEGDEAAVQIAGSDLVVINKCDKVSTEQFDEARKAIFEINATARTIECSYGNVDPSAVMNLKAFDSETPPSNTLTGDGAAGSEKAHHSDHNHEEKVQNHAKISTVNIELSPSGQPLDEAAAKLIETRLQHLLWEKEIDGNPIEIYRAKGRLVTSRTRILQGVREIYELVEVTHEPEESSKLILIGRGVRDVEDKLLSYFGRLED